MPETSSPFPSSFNGAVAVKPRKTRETLVLMDQPPLLQWGCGCYTMETIGRDLIMGAINTCIDLCTFFAEGN